MKLLPSLDIACALFALVAALFWFMSAAGKLPPMIAYWDSTPTNDPYYVAIAHSARLNRFAAGFSGLSALCLAISTIVRYLGVSY
jgi:hypothetical protein